MNWINAPSISIYVTFLDFQSKVKTFIDLSKKTQNCSNKSYKVGYWKIPQLMMHFNPEIDPENLLLILILISILA